MNTHIQSLNSNTQKARRRLRKILGLAPGADLSEQDVARAVDQAQVKERTPNLEPKKK